MINVLVVDDSAVNCEFLTYVLNSSTELHVIGTASDGMEAIEAVRLFNPDIITMDIHMPKMDGFEATRRIMSTQPKPIVIVTGSSSAKEVATSFRALEVGALAVVSRPLGIGAPQYEQTTQELIQTVKLMAEVKVIRRWPRFVDRTIPPDVVAKKTEMTPVAAKLVAIGGSTGGPVVIQTIISRLPREFPVPVLIVQHIAAGFVTGFTEWLALYSKLPLHVAADNELLMPGHIYLAPDGFHMGVIKERRIVLSSEPPENGLRPSVSYLFRSVAQVYGRESIGVLLTGMGRDGAGELKLMKDEGAITIAQDEASSIVHGMPGEAIKLGGATYVLSPEEIASKLIAVISKR